MSKRNESMFSEMQSMYRLWKTGAEQYNNKLSSAVNLKLGVTLGMFKTTKNLVHLGSLLLAGYAISHGAEPFIALLFVALIISGPEILEWWLVNQDFEDYKKNK